MIKSKELEDYISLLRAHDWKYDFSDDHTVWSRGKASYEKILSLAKTHPALEDLLKTWGSFAFRLHGVDLDTLNLKIENLRQHTKDEDEETA